VILFGGKIAANLARTSGQSIKEMKKIKKEFTETILDEKPKTK
jgi:Sec-independent protein translocase protein TatA